MRYCLSLDKQYRTGRTTTRTGIKGVIPQKRMPKLDLSGDEEYVANLVNVNGVVINVQQCSLLHGYAIPA